MWKPQLTDFFIGREVTVIVDNICNISIKGTLLYVKNNTNRGEHPRSDILILQQEKQLHIIRGYNVTKR